MRRGACTLLLLGTAGWCLTWPAAAVASESHCGISRLVEVPGDGVPLVEGSDAPSAVRWAEVRERGRELVVTAGVDLANRPIGGRPPRLGIERIRIDPGARLILKSAARYGDTSVADVTILCDAPVPDPLTDCIARAREVEAGRSVPSPSEPFSSELCVALVQHAAGAWASRESRATDSIAHYDNAIAGWRALGDRAREGAAWLGKAEQLQRKAMFEDAIAATQEAERLSKAAGVEYFAARAVMERCINLQAIGRASVAIACNAGLAVRFTAIGEFNDAANVRINEVSMALEEGRIANAQAGIDALPAALDARLSPMVAGRLSLTRANLDLARGRFDMAIAHVERALRRFESIPDRRWIANAQLAGARVLLALDATTDAAALASQAERHFAAMEARARQASAQVMLAQIARTEGKAQDAIRWALRAADAYRTDGQRWRALDAELIAVGLGDDGAAERAVAALADRAELPPALSIKGDLAFASRDLLRNDWPAVRRRSAALAAAALDPDQTIRRRILDARLAINEGQPAFALQTIDGAISELHRLASYLSGAALRLSLGTRLLDLQAVWIDAYLATPATTRPDHAVVWQMLLRTRPEALLQRAQVGGAIDPEAIARFEWATAQALLPADDSISSDTNAQRALLAYHGALGEARAAATEPSPALDWVRSRLGPDQEMLAFGRGTERFLRLRIRDTGTTETAVPFDADVRATLERIVDAIKRPTSPLSELDGHAQALSNTLLQGLDGAAPKHLFLLADMLQSSGVVPLLKWPGNGEPLAHTSELTWVTFGRPTEAHDGSAVPLKVFVAASTGPTTGVPVPMLAGALQEPGMIQRALASRTVETVQGEAFTGDSLRRALAQQGSWVHVAAHGRTIGTLLGQSGLVIDGTPQSGTPGFVSWMSLVESPIGADLVVLNACDLAATPEWNPQGRTVFATAISAAGARNTIAALWTVSDRAAAIWVPTLYAGMTGDSASPASALASAQRALRASRMHRHPYYWASLIHLGRLP
jgi:hypothetical protein